MLLDFDRLLPKHTLFFSGSILMSDLSNANYVPTVLGIVLN